MQTDSPLVIFFFIIAALAILGSCYSCISIVYIIYQQRQQQQERERQSDRDGEGQGERDRQKSKSIDGIINVPFSIARLILLYMHITLIVQEIVSLPFVYSNDNDESLCRAMGFLHTYSALSNVIAMWFLTIYGVNYMHCEYAFVDKFVSKWKEVLTFGFPLITLIPFIGGKNAFGVANDIWCELTETNRMTTILCYYLWIWLFVGASLVFTIWLLVDSCRVGSESFKSTMGSMGVYGIVTVINWIPHTARRFFSEYYSQQQYLGLTIPIYLTGIIYAALYVFNPTLANLPDKVRESGFPMEFQLSDLEAISFNPMDRQGSLASFSNKDRILK